MATSAYPPQGSQGPADASQGGGAGPQGAPPDQGAPQAPSQRPANDLQTLLARWYQAAKEIAASDPRVASGLNKVQEGLQEAQTALVTPPQPTPPSQTPQY